MASIGVDGTLHSMFRIKDLFFFGGINSSGLWCRVIVVYSQCEVRISLNDTQ